MESSVLFYLAARAAAAGEEVVAATILTVSDVLTEDVGPEQTYLPLGQLEQVVDAMIDTALSALTRPPA
jgi:purine-nucleoside phosphorylase